MMMSNKAITISAVLGAAMLVLFAVLILPKPQAWYAARISLADAISPCSILIAGAKTKIDGVELIGERRDILICGTKGADIKVFGNITAPGVNTFTGHADRTSEVILPKSGSGEVPLADQVLGLIGRAEFTAAQRRMAIDALIAKGPLE